MKELSASAPVVAVEWLREQARPFLGMRVRVRTCAWAYVFLALQLD